jgi:hypothetical protein
MSVKIMKSQVFPGQASPVVVGRHLHTGYDHQVWIPSLRAGYLGEISIEAVVADTLAHDAIQTLN